MTARGYRARMRAIGIALALALLAGACAPSASADGPGAVVEQALAMVEAKDVNGLRGLACAGQEDRIRDQLGLPGDAGLGTELLPGLDTQALIDAVRMDTSRLTLGDAAIDGDVAEVPVSGNLKVTFDKAAMRPLLRKVLDQQGSTMTDEQLDALLGTLESYGQDLPLDQAVRLVREGGSWKICQESVGAPAAS